MSKDQWEVVFYRPKDAMPTDCEAQILSELCNVKQGAAYNHILSDMFYGHSLMRADVDQDTAEKMADLGNQKLEHHSSCKEPPTDRLFVAKPMAVLN